MIDEDAWLKMIEGFDASEIAIHRFDKLRMRTLDWTSS